MKTFAFIAVAAVIVVAGFAHADQTSAASISGPEAKARFEQMRIAFDAGQPTVEMPENSMGATTFRAGKQTCTLFGSHAGAAEARGGEEYVCELLP